MTEDDLLTYIGVDGLLRIRYVGGSHPGTVKILRIQTLKEGMLRAIDQADGASKLYVLAKIRSVNDKDAEALELNPVTDGGFIRTIESIHQELSSRLVELGWHVQLAEDCISLHRVTKSGKPLKGPDASLTFKPIVYDLVFDGDRATEANHRESKRPWLVSSKNKSVSYGDCNRAIMLFMEKATEFSPAKKAV